MINRYSTPILTNIWSEQEKYRSWAKVERAHLEVLVERGEAPSEVLNAFDSAIETKTPNDYLNREQETGHDVIAFIAELADSMGKSGLFLHKGLTSSDIVDTALVLRIKQSIKIVMESLNKALVAFAQRAFEFHNTLCIGRTHGIHAEPLSFGQVLANHFAEFDRARKELAEAEKNISFGKISGAVGNYTQLDPQFEYAVLNKLELNVEPVSTQIIPRDRILNVAKAILSCANSIDRFSTNLRHWSRTEVNEVLEPFSKKQKGSSAMPHKKNPILSENLCGLARTIRGYFTMLMENAALWDERDISHSSVERIAIPDMFTVIDFMLTRLARIVQNMVVNTDTMHINLWQHGGLWASQSVLTALINKGLSRTDAYELVQSIALKILNTSATSKISTSSMCVFYEALNQDAQIKKYLNESELKNIFSTEKYLNYVPLVFKRVFGIEPKDYTGIENIHFLNT